MSRSPVHRQWDEYRRTISWASPDDPGALRYGTYEPVVSTEIQAQVVRIPSGESTPVLRGSSDHLIVHLEGEVDLLAGGKIIPLKSCDLATLPAGTSHSYRNPGSDDALFYVAHDRPDEGTHYRLTSPDEDAANVQLDGGELNHLAWADYRRRIIYRGALSERNGYERGVYPFIETETMKGHAVRVAPGQGSPWHTSGGDTIFVGLRGELEFYVDGAAPKAYAVGPRDILMAPDAFYGFQNLGFEDALYFAMSAKGEGKPKPTYHEPAVVGDPLAGPGPELGSTPQVRQ